ncbi:MAG: transcriptional regulatory protein RtcR, partial [Pirellulaceae bacterium]
MKTVLIGLLGSQLDAGVGARRWERWRPSVGLCQQPQLLLDRYELLYAPGDRRLASIVAEDIGSISPETEVCASEFAVADPWDFEEVYGSLHQWARSYKFDLENERYLVNITTGTHVAQICLFLLTESRHMPGSLLQASPPGKRATAAIGTYRLIDLDLSQYDRLAERFALEQTEGSSFLKSGIETKNDEFNRMITQIERVATKSREPLLLTGPTGAGKSQLARRIFELKKLRQQIEGRLVEVNCATLRGDQAMSTLFGHVKGAYTGASGDRDGLLRAANGGVLFLDEIGEMAADEQAMLLRAVEDKRFQPVGSDVEVASDFQLIAGTNRDLQAEVISGGFREDLLARINLWTFRLLGLSERREDIEANVHYELRRYAEKTGKQISFNKQALAQFLAFSQLPSSSWAANFRDLNASITRMATLAAGGRINEELVGDEVQRLKAGW